MGFGRISKRFWLDILPKPSKQDPFQYPHNRLKSEGAVQVAPSHNCMTVRILLVMYRLVPMMAHGVQGVV